MGGHVAHMWKMTSVYKILVAKSEGIDHSEDLDVDERILLEWILGK
jgi:hypothetical protein